MTTIKDDTDCLVLYHYDECTDSSDANTKTQRGVIRCAKTNDIVCQSFGYTHEYELSDFDKWSPILKDSIQNCHIYLSEEGSLLRLYFHEDSWHLSTHKRIDAFSSYWSSERSFGELFLDALEYYFTNGPGKGKIEYESPDHLFDVFCDTLDRECVYTFLLRTNKDTRIVCRPPTHPTLYFGGYFYNGMRLAGNPTLVEWPTRIHFTSAEAVRDLVNTLDPLTYQGVIVFMTNQTVFKVMTPGYLELAKLRGCEPSFYKAYLRLRDDNDKVKKLMQVFPERRTDMKEIEMEIANLAKKIFRFYARRYMKKEHIVVNKHYYYLMRLAHSWHCQARDTNIVTINKFLELLDKQNKQFLNLLLSIKE